MLILSRNFSEDTVPAVANAVFWTIHTWACLCPDNTRSASFSISELRISGIT